MEEVKYLFTEESVAEIDRKIDAAKESGIPELVVALSETLGSVVDNLQYSKGVFLATPVVYSAKRDKNSAYTGITHHSTLFQQMTYCKKVFALVQKGLFVILTNLPDIILKAKSENRKTLPVTRDGINQSIRNISVGIHNATEYVGFMKYVDYLNKATPTNEKLVVPKYMYNIFYDKFEELIKSLNTLVMYDMPKLQFITSGNFDTAFQGNRLQSAAEVFSLVSSHATNKYFGNENDSDDE